MENGNSEALWLTEKGDDSLEVDFTHVYTEKVLLQYVLRQIYS